MKKINVNMLKPGDLFEVQFHSMENPDIYFNKIPGCLVENVDDDQSMKEYAVYSNKVYMFLTHNEQEYNISILDKDKKITFLYNNHDQFWKYE